MMYSEKYNLAQTSLTSAHQPSWLFSCVGHAKASGAGSIYYTPAHTCGLCDFEFEIRIRCRSRWVNGLFFTFSNFFLVQNETTPHHTHTKYEGRITIEGALLPAFDWRLIAYCIMGNDDPLPVPAQLEAQLGKCKTVRQPDYYKPRNKTAAVSMPGCCIYFLLVSI
jgi:hypothetical protein